MNYDQQIILIESVIANPNRPSADKIDLIRQTLRDCRQKEIGKIVLDAIEKPKKKIDGFEGVVTKRKRKKTVHSDEYNKKHGLTPNAKQLLQSAKADSEGRY